MKKKMMAVCVLLAVLCNGASAQVLDRIVAVVNGEIITLMELDKQFTQVIEASGAPLNPATRERARSGFLDSMINEMLLRQEAERLQISVSQTEVENAVRKFKARRQLTDAALKRSLRLQHMTMEEFRDQIRQDIMKQQILGFMVRRKVVVTDEDVDAYIDAHHDELALDKVVALQLLILPEKDAAQKIRTDILDGTLSFSEAVASLSIGPRDGQGMLEDLYWDELAPDWQDALNGVAVGELTKPFLVRDTWVVLKLLRQHQGAEKDLVEIRDNVREALMRPKMEERFQEYMTRLRTQAVIEKR